MSRWDALKPEANNNHQSKKGCWKRHLNKDDDSTILTELDQLDSFDDETMQRWKTRLQRVTSPRLLGKAFMVCMRRHKRGYEMRALLIQLMRRHEIQLAPEQLESCIANLRSNLRDHEMVALFIERFHPSIRAGEMSKTLVKSTILPYLDESQQSYRGLKILLSDLSHASAILLPLVVYVAEDGNEETIPNPLGREVITSLQIQLPASCVTLAKALDSIKKLDVGEAVRPDFRVISFYISSSISESSTDALILLRSVLTTYPTSFSHFQALLIGESISTGMRTLRACECPARCPVLMDKLHSLTDVDLVCDCTVLLLDSFPLAKWLNPGAVGSLQTFGQNVRTKLIDLMCITRCRLMEDYAITDLTTRLCLAVPFGTDPTDALTEAALQLISAVADLVVRDSHPLLTGAMIEWIGGKARPNGGTVPMIEPLKCWFATTRSDAFFHYLWKCLLSGRSKPPTVLGAILKSCPEIVLEDADRYESFRQTVNLLMESAKTMTHGLALVEQLAQGRQESVVTALDASFPVFIFSVLERAYVGANNARILIVQTLGCLKVSEWRYAFGTDKAHSSIDFLRICAIEGNAKDRAVACKAIGDVVTNTLSFLHAKRPNDFEWICSLAVSVALGQVRNPNSGVRSMALFIIGNLFLELAMLDFVGGQCRFLSSDFETLCAVTSASLHDQSDKVVGNAIRSIGHMGAGVSRYPALTFLGSDLFIQAVIEKLATKVHRAIGGEINANLTWKQRSAAKRHGWGACNSLGILLDCGYIEQNIVVEEEALGPWRAAFRALQSCIQHWETLSDKVTVASLRAICRIKQDRLAKATKQSGLVGQTVVDCLRIHSSKSVRNNRLQDAVSNAMKHMVECIDLFDASVILNALEDSELLVLYHFMLDSETTVAAYESFVTAMRRSDLVVSVDIERRFVIKVQTDARRMENRIDVTSGLDGPYESEDDQDEL